MNILVLLHQKCSMLQFTALQNVKADVQLLLEGTTALLRICEVVNCYEKGRRGGESSIYIHC